MICRRCLLRAARRKPSSSTTIHQFSHTTPKPATRVPADTVTANNPRPNDKPAATSTSAAQPFSEQFTYSPSTLRDLPIHQSKKPGATVQSSVMAGTVLKGLNFMKNKQDPIAMEDGEYPAWLWGVLNQEAKEGKRGEEGEGDLYAKSKKQRRIAAKALRKQQLLHPELLQPKVPIYEQSVDLPSGDGTWQGAVAAGEARGELTKAMRIQRRAKIKEDNFLKAMG